MAILSTAGRSRSRRWIFAGGHKDVSIRGLRHPPAIAYDAPLPDQQTQSLQRHNGALHGTRGTSDGVRDRGVPRIALTIDRKPLQQLKANVLGQRRNSLGAAIVAEKEPVTRPLIAVEKPARSRAEHRAAMPRTRVSCRHDLDISGCAGGRQSRAPERRFPLQAGHLRFCLI